MNFGKKQKPKPIPELPEPYKTITEILGVLRNYIGPGQDLVLCRLSGDKPEYTGVVAGMSGSPVYIDGKLLGAISYRIGQFSKDPIAGITPIEQMLEVRNLPIENAGNEKTGNREQGIGNSNELSTAALPSSPIAPQATIQEMDTPLTMSGFHQQAIDLWQKQMAGTALAAVAAGGLAHRGA